MQGREEFLEKINTAKSRLLAASRVMLASRILLAAASAAAVLAVLSRKFFFPSLGVVMAALVCAALLAAIAGALSRRMTAFDGAVFLDAGLGLSERLATATELLLGAGGKASRPAAECVIRDAFKYSEKIDPLEAVPIKWPGEATLLAGMVALTVLMLFIPTAYGAASMKAAKVHRVSVRVSAGLAGTKAALERKGNASADLAKEIGRAGELVKSDPEAGLKAVLALSRSVAGKLEREDAREAALAEMKKHPALAALAEKIEAHKGIAPALAKAASTAAGGTGSEMRIALEAVKSALADDKALMRTVEGLLHELEKKNRDAFERNLGELAKELSREADREALEIAEARLRAEAGALGRALGKDFTLQGSSGKADAATKSGAPEKTVRLAKTYEDVDALIEKEHVPPRFRGAVIRYFKREQ